VTITEFLEARIAEDEARASSGWARLGDSRWETTEYGQDFLAPSAVLAECAAKRAIIADHSEFVEAIDYLSAALPGGLNQEPDAPWRTSTLRHLAAVYADHADYREEWVA